MISPINPKQSSKHRFSLTSLSSSLWEHRLIPKLRHPTRKLGTFMSIDHEVEKVAEQGYCWKVSKDKEVSITSALISEHLIMKLNMRHL